MRLTDIQLREQLPQLPAWEYAPECGGLLRRHFVFADFATAFGFMAQIAIHAERTNHHPEWFNVYNRVHVTLTTHDCNGLSMNDIALAVLMDRCAAAFTAASH